MPIPPFLAVKRHDHDKYFSQPCRLAQLFHATATAAVAAATTVDEENCVNHAGLGYCKLKFIGDRCCIVHSLID